MEIGSSARFLRHHVLRRVLQRRAAFTTTSATQTSCRTLCLCGSTSAPRCAPRHSTVSLVPNSASSASLREPPCFTTSATRTSCQASVPLWFKQAPRDAQLVVQQRILCRALRLRVSLLHHDVDDANLVPSLCVSVVQTSAPRCAASHSTASHVPNSASSVSLRESPCTMRLRGESRALDPWEKPRVMLCFGDQCDVGANGLAGKRGTRLQAISPKDLYGFRFVSFV